MNILDYLILIIIILGALYGYKRGFLGSLINFIGTIVVIILAFYLKNPISVFLYEHFPFYNFGGFYKGISVYNILLYEGISFLIIEMNDRFFILDGNVLIKFVNNNDRKSIPFEFIQKEGLEIKLKFSPTLDYITVLDTLISKKEEILWKRLNLKEKLIR